MRKDGMDGCWGGLMSATPGACGVAEPVYLGQGITPGSWSMACWARLWRSPTFQYAGATTHIGVVILFGTGHTLDSTRGISADQRDAANTIGRTTFPSGEEDSSTDNGWAAIPPIFILGWIPGFQTFECRRAHVSTSFLKSNHGSQFLKYVFRFRRVQRSLSGSHLMTCSASL